MYKVELTEEQMSIVLDCIGLVIQMPQDPKQTIVNAAKLLPVVAHLQAAKKVEEEYPYL